jgi:hypothetical protein
MDENKFAPICKLALLLALTILAACSSKPSHVDILASVKADAPGPAWSLESSAYAALGKALFGPGQHVVVTPVSDLSATEAPIFDESIDGDSLIGANPMQIKERAAQVRVEYESVRVKLAFHRASRPRTEIISAVVASASRFKEDAQNTDKVLIILSTGFEQSGMLNMGDASLSLRSATPAILRALRHRNLIPEISGVKVCMAGITPGENGWADTNASLAIKSFWAEYFRAAGARLVDFGPTLSDTCIRTVHRIDYLAGPSS